MPTVHIHFRDAANPYAPILKDCAQKLRSAANKCDGAARSDSLIVSDPSYRDASINLIQSLLGQASDMLRGIR